MPNTPGGGATTPGGGATTPGGGATTPGGGATTPGHPSLGFVTKTLQHRTVSAAWVPAFEWVWSALHVAGDDASWDMLLSVAGVTTCLNAGADRSEDWERGRTGDPFPAPCAVGGAVPLPKLRVLWPDEVEVEVEGVGVGVCAAMTCSNCSTALSTLPPPRDPCLDSLRTTKVGLTLGERPTFGLDAMVTSSTRRLVRQTRAVWG